MHVVLPFLDDLSKSCPEARKKIHFYMTDSVQRIKKFLHALSKIGARDPEKQRIFYLSLTCSFQDKRIWLTNLFNVH